MAERKRNTRVFRRLAAALCAAGLLCALSGPVSAEEEVWVDILQTDFSDGIPAEIGQVVNKGTIVWSEQDQNVRVELPASGGAAPYLELPGGGVPAERYMLEADFYVGDSFGVSSNLVGKGATKGEGFNIESGKIGLPGASESFPVTGNAWYHIRYVFDIGAGTCDLDVNGAAVVQGAPIRNAQPEFYSFRIFNWKAGGYYLIDNVKLQYQQKPSNLRAGLTAPVSGAQYEIGDTVVVTAEASSDIGVSRVELYCGGQLFGARETEPYTFSYLAETAGTAVFYAVAWDSRGGSVQTDPVTVSIRESPRPVIRFLNLQDGGAYGPEDLARVEISAQAPAGVESVELSVNGALWGTAGAEPYSFDLTGAAPGPAALSAKARSADGYESTAEIWIEILPRQDRIAIFDTDFEGGFPKGLDPFPDKDGKIVFETVDSAHGQSVRVEKPGDNNPYLILHNSTNAARYVMEADFYMGPNFGMSTNLVGGEKPDGTGFNIESGGIILYDGGNAQKLASIQPETWYHVKFETDFQANTYSLWLDGQKLARDFAMRQAISGFNSLRIFNWQKGSYYCIDNLKFYGVVDYPAIARISHGGSLTDTEIPFDAEKLNVVLTAGIRQDQVSAETVQLLAEGTAVPLNSVSLAADNVLEISPKYHFISGQEYAVQLSGTLQNLAGNPIGTPLLARFVTERRPLDLTEAELSEQGGRLAFRAVAENRTDADQTCFGVVNVWEGQRLVLTRLCAVTAGKGGEAELSVLDVPVTASQHAEAFVTDSLDSPMPVSDKVLRYGR